MIYHKHFASVLIYHPGRSRNMRNCIFSGKCVLIVPDPSQDQSFVLFFLFIEWGIVFYLSDGILTCHLVIFLISSYIIPLSQALSLPQHFPHVSESFSNNQSISCQSLHLTNLSLGSSARLFHGRSNTTTLPYHYIVFFPGNFIQSFSLDFKTFSLIKVNCTCILLVNI